MSDPPTSDEITAALDTLHVTLETSPPDIYEWYLRDEFAAAAREKAIGILNRIHESKERPNMKQALEDHSIAEIFPLIDAGELEELSDSIERSGQREPIVLLAGKILDGRNRYRACVARNIPPQTRIYDPKTDGNSPLRFVLDKNLNRRQLTKGQRAIIAAQALTALQAEATEATKAKKTAQAEASAEGFEPDGKPPKPHLTVVQGDQPTQETAAAAAGVSKRTIATAAKLEKDNPKAAAEVKAGKKSLNQAAKETDQKQTAKDKQRKEIKDRIRNACGDSFADAFLANDVLKTAVELNAFLKLEDAEMPAVANLVAIGWKVKRAAAHVKKAINADTTIADLINHAIQEGDSCVVNHEGWEIAVTKIN